MISKTIFILVISTLFISLNSLAVDEGFEKQYITANETIERTCYSAPNIPPYLKGTFFIPSVAQFEVGDQNFTGLLDGFGKLQKFEFSYGILCFQSKMMDTQFYNQSIKLNKVAPSLLFSQTVPPTNYLGIQNILGPNDNVFVNTIDIAGQYMAVTDSQRAVKFDPLTLSMQAEMQFQDHNDQGKMALGSAHPLPFNNTGCYIGIDNQQNMINTKHTIIVHKICPDKPNERQILNKYDNDFLPYFHSFGLTQKYAILPHQPYYFDFNEISIFGQTIQKAFKDITRNTHEVMIVPLDGSAPIKFNITNKLYFTHFINSYDFDDGVIFDLCAQDDNTFGHLLDLQQYRDANVRNDYYSKSQVRRYALYLSGPRKGTYDIIDISPKYASQDFPNLNLNYLQKHYCFYYAVEFFHDQKHLGSISIVKQNLCGNGNETIPIYWYKEGYFLSEPTFVPSDDPKSEDDGVLLFTALHGASDSSYIYVVDALTMTTIEEIYFPSIITFTTHGKFYPDNSSPKSIKKN